MTPDAVHTAKLKQTTKNDWSIIDLQNEIVSLRAKLVWKERELIKEDKEHRILLQELRKNIKQLKTEVILGWGGESRILEDYIPKAKVQESYNLLFKNGELAHKKFEELLSDKGKP